MDDHGPPPSRVRLVSCINLLFLTASDSVPTNPIAPGPELLTSEWQMLNASLTFNEEEGIVHEDSQRIREEEPPFIWGLSLRRHWACRLASRFLCYLLLLWCHNRLGVDIVHTLSPPCIWALGQDCFFLILVCVSWKPSPKPRQYPFKASWPGCASTFILHSNSFSWEQFFLPRLGVSLRLWMNGVVASVCYSCR